MAATLAALNQRLAALTKVLEEINASLKGDEDGPGTPSESA